MNDPHHDHQLFEMSIQPTRPTMTHHCPLCLHAEGSHSRVCPKRCAAGAWVAVDGLEHGDMPDGVYLLGLADGTLLVGYVNNDCDGSGEWVDVAYHNDTRQVNPADIVRYARMEG